MEGNRKKIKQILPWLFFLLGCFFIMLNIAPGFINFNNIMNVLTTTAFVAIPAIGMAIIMLSGSFDLSFVGIIGVSAVAIIIMLNNGISLFVALSAALIISISLELVNAFFVIKLGMHPWLTTLGTMLATLGLEKVLSHGYFMSIQSEFFNYIRFNSFFYVPVVVWVLLITFVLSTTLINKTKYGFHLYAVGGNSQAAKKAGLRVDMLQFSTYILMGVFCWLSAIVYLSQLSGYPPEAAYINQLEVILAVFFGMAISKNNVINVPGTFFGAVFVSLMANGLGLAGVTSYWVKLIEGCLIIIVVIRNSISRGEVSQI